MTPIATLGAVTLDCPDPAALAAFYQAITGYQQLFSSEEAAFLGGDGEVKLGFQRVSDHRRPDWPGATKQLHLDFSVDDLAEAERRLLELGATKPEFQPGGDRWVVLLDPAGHPFCITVMA